MNEVLVNHRGDDLAEYVELYGPPGASLEGLSLLVTEDDAGERQGRIDRRIDFTAAHRLGANGFLLVGNPDGLASGYGVRPDVVVGRDFLENSSLTVALVRTAGLPDERVSPTIEVVDAVALTDGGEGDRSSLDAPTVGPDGSRLPAGVRRRIDGIDTDTAGDFVVADFELGPDNTPTSSRGGATPRTPSEPGQALRVPDVQGAGARSPFEGRTVVVEGVLTAFGRDGRGFFLQDAEGDGDPDTSDAVFVAVPRDAEASEVRAGRRVRVEGVVEERGREGELPLTRIARLTSVTDLGPGAEIAATPWTELPDLDLDEAIDFFERHEGMLVAVEDALVVGPTSRFGDFEVLASGNQDAGSGRLERPGGLFVRDLGGGRVDYNPERIAVSWTEERAVPVSPGDRVDLVGVVDYAWGRYLVRVTSCSVHPARLEPTAKRERPAGLRFASFNVENLFDLERNPVKDDERSTPTADELETKLAKLEATLIDELGTPALLAIQEVENTAVLQRLADRVNERAGTRYRAASEECSDGRGIEPAFLWDERHVQLVRAYQLGGDDVAAAYGPRSPSPGREPLVGEFCVGDATWTVVSCHLKSKGGDDALFGDRRPPVRVTEVQRKAQARCVRRLVDSLLAADPAARVIVAGDMNDFPFAEPGEGDDHPVGLLAGSGSTALTNLLERVPPAERFTYIWRGNRQVLDHVLVSRALVGSVLDVRVHHLNAEHPYALERDPHTARRASDHDPVEVTFAID